MSATEWTGFKTQGLWILKSKQSGVKTERKQNWLGRAEILIFTLGQEWSHGC